MSGSITSRFNLGERRRLSTSKILESTKVSIEMNPVLRRHQFTPRYLLSQRESCYMGRRNPNRSGNKVRHTETRFGTV